MFPNVPSPLAHTSADMLEFARLREMVAGYATTAPGREWTLALQPSGEAGWAAVEQQRVSEALRLLRAGPSFDFHGLIDPGDWLDRARIHGAVLEVDELRALSATIIVGRFTRARFFFARTDHAAGREPIHWFGAGPRRKV